MRITKHGHACVTVDDLVVDPGMFTDINAVDGASAVLITHEHPDHWNPDHLAATNAPIFTIQAVADAIAEQAPDAVSRITVVAPGESFEAAGLRVAARGEDHAVIHPEFPRFKNSGYLIEAGGQRLFHPGDAIDQVVDDVDVLFMPASAPWARASELIDYARAVKAPVNVPIHDRVYSEAGAAIFDSHVARFFEPEGLGYRRLADGESL